MSIRIRTLASGSEGNALLADFDGFCFLIDAGIGIKAMEEQLDKISLPAEGIQALLLTHEHIDHCKGLAAVMKKWDAPVYTSRGSFEGLAKHAFFSRLTKERFCLFKAGESFSLGPLTVRTVPISHDAAEPAAFRIDASGYSFGSLTDLGCFTEETVSAFQGVNSLLLEANHNRRILEAGPFLQRIYHPDLREVTLGHLSRTNNFEPLARDTVWAALQEIPGANEHITLNVAPALGLSQTMGTEVNYVSA